MRGDSTICYPCRYDLTLFLCVFKDMVKQTKAKTFQAYLDSCHRRYSCVHCRAHLANHDDLISKVRVIFVNCDAVCIKGSRVCLFSVVSRQSGPCLPVQFCVSITSGKKKTQSLNHIVMEKIVGLTHFVISG